MGTWALVSAGTHAMFTVSCIRSGAPSRENMSDVMGSQPLYWVITRSTQQNSRIPNPAAESDILIGLSFSRVNAYAE
jgi:hypothetical protein